MMNRVVLVGRLTKDPELHYTASGIPVASFTLAINRNFKNGQGEQEADFINCVVWKKPAENVANYLKKGALAGVDGRVQTRNYEGQDGKRVYVTEVVADSVQFLDSRQSSQNDTNNANSNQSDTNTGTSNQNGNNGQNRGNTRVDQDPFANSGQPIDISDDDLPF